MYPSDTHCQISCIGIDQACVFENACGYRKKFLRAIGRKQRTSMKRYIKKNCGRNSYVSYADLIGLIKVYLSTGFACYYCGKKMSIGDENTHDTCTIDHRKAIDNGGTNDLDNIVFCCEECNLRKGVN